MAIEAGSVYTRLSGLFESRNYDEFDRRNAKAEAQAKNPKVVTLAGDFEERGFDEWNREYDKAAAKASKRIDAQLGVDVDRRGLASFGDDLDRARLEAASLRTELKSTERGLKAMGDGADDGGRKLGLLGRAFGDSSRGAQRLHFHINRLLPGLSLTTRLPVFRIAAIGQAIAAIIPPVVALTGALGPMLGLLGALPGLAIAGIGALGSAVLGLGSALGAIGKSWQAQTKAMAGTAAAQRSVLSSSEAVRSARESLANAERGVSDAHRGVEKAQRDLNDAEEEAVKNIRDMRDALRAKRLEEQGDTLSVRDALNALHETETDSTATSLDLANARQRVREAEQRLREGRRDSARQQQELNQAERDGVARAPRVVDAHERLREAERGVADAQRAVKDGAIQVRLAQEEQALVSDKAAGGTNALREAMVGLSPAGRRFVQFVTSELFPVYRDLQSIAERGLLPGLQQGIAASMHNLPVFTGVVRDYSKALGDAAQQQGELLGEKGVGRELGTIFAAGERTLRSFTEALLNFERGLFDVGVAAGPLQDWLGRITVKLSESFRIWAESGRESGRLEQFFARTARNTELAVEAVWDFGQALKNIASIGRRVWGQDLLENINDAAQAFRDWTESIKGQNEIEDYFRRWRRTWVRIAGLVRAASDEFKRLRREGQSSVEALAQIFSEAFAKAIPAIADNVAKSMPHIVEGFVDGFLAADAWGKLVLTGWLLAKFGGLRAAFGAGATLATGVAEGFVAKRAAGAASAVPVGAGAGAGAGAGGIAARVAAAAGPVGIAAAITAAIAGGVFLALSPDQRRMIRDKVADFFTGAFKSLDLGRSVDELKAAWKDLTSIFSGDGEAFGELKQTWADLEDVFDSAPIRFALARIGDLFRNAFGTWIGSIGRALPGIGQALHGVTEVIHGFVEVIAGILTLDFRKAWGGVKRIFKGGADELIGVLRASTAPFREVAARLGQAVAGPLGAAWRGIRTGFTTMISFIAGGFSSLLGLVGGVLDKLPGVVSRFIPGFKALKEGVRDAQVAIDDFRDGLRDTNDQAERGKGIDTARRRVRGLKDDLKDLKKGTDDYRVTADKLEDAQDKLNRRIRLARAATVIARGGFLRLTNNVSELGAGSGHVSEYLESQVNKLLREFGAKPLTIKVQPFKPVGPLQLFGGEGRRGGIVHGYAGIQRFRAGGRVRAAVSSGEMLIEPGGRTSIVPGRRTRADNVLTSLRRGTAVLTDHGQSLLAMGASVKQAVRHQLPHFAAGGIAGAIAAANRFERAKFPYKWGGGHEATPAPFEPADCSGSVSYVLQHAGINIPTMVSGAMMGIGKPGPGALSVYANSHHVMMGIMGRLFGTSGTNPGGGAGWLDGKDPHAYHTSPFTTRHFGPADFGAFGRVPRLAIKGGTATMRRILGGQEKRGRRAANRFLSRVGPIGRGDVGDAGPGFNVHSAAEFLPYWRKANPDVASWAPTFAGIVERESSFDPRAQNFLGLGHAGWYQFDPPTWSGFKPRGAPGYPAGPFQPALATRAAGNVVRREGAAGVQSRWAETIGGRLGGFVQSFAGGGVAGIVGGAEDAFTSGTNFPAAQGRIGKWADKVTKIRQNIADWGRTYTTTARRFDLSEEQFIDEGEVDDDGNIIRQPSLRQDEIAHRVGELNELIRQRERIVRAYENLIAYVTQIRDQYQRMIDRAKQSMGLLKNALSRLAGRKGKEASSARERIGGWIDKLGDRITGLRANRDAQSQVLTDEGFNLEDARLDVEDLKKELAPLLGGGAGLTLPDAFKPGQSADTAAQLEQEQSRNAELMAHYQDIRTAFQAFAGPGDLGRGGPTALQAAVAPTGQIGPGYTVGPSGQLIPVVGPGGSVGPGGDGAGFNGGGNSYTVVMQSVVPYTRDQARIAASASMEGIDAQAPNLASRTEVNL